MPQSPHKRTVYTQRLFAWFPVIWLPCKHQILVRQIGNYPPRESVFYAYGTIRGLCKKGSLPGYACNNTAVFEEKKEGDLES